MAEELKHVAGMQSIQSTPTTNPRSHRINPSTAVESLGACIVSTTETKRQQSSNSNGSKGMKYEDDDAGFLPRSTPTLIHLRCTYYL